MIKIQKRLRKILANENQGTRHKDLVVLAKEVGVSILQYKGGANGYGPADETELVARIREVARTNSVVITSVAAVVSAIIALQSATVAWLVLICK